MPTDEIGTTELVFNKQNPWSSRSQHFRYEKVLLIDGKLRSSYFVCYVLIVEVKPLGFGEYSEIMSDVQNVTT